MLKKISLTFLLGFLVLASFGQENPQPGFLIQNNGDTLNGYIDYRNWESKPDILLFKTSLTGEYSKYGPLDIKGYGVEYELYRSAIVDTELSPDKDGYLTHEPELQIVRDTAFLQVVLGGDKGLFFYRNRADKNQYYIWVDSDYQLLVHKRYNKTLTVFETNEKVGTNPIMINKKYIGQLSIYLQDCPEIKSRFEKTSYNGQSIRSLILAYKKHTGKDVSTGKDVEFRRKSKKLKAEFGVLTGLSLTSVQFIELKSPRLSTPWENDNLHFLDDLNFKNHTGVVPGVFFNIAMSSFQGKWSIHNEFTYNTYKSSDFTLYEVYGSRFDALFDIRYFRLNNLLRYKFPIKKCAIFFNAGISNSFFTRGDDYIIKTTENPHKVEGVGYFDNITSPLALLGGLGAAYNRFSLEYRYENHGKATNVSYINMDIKRQYLILSYKL